MLTITKASGLLFTIITPKVSSITSFVLNLSAKLNL